MQIAGQEIKYKRLPLVEQVKRLHEGDALKQKLIDYITTNQQAELDALASMWSEWIGGVCEGAMPPVDAFATEEVIAIVQGFTLKASTLPK